VSVCAFPNVADNATSKCITDELFFTISDFIVIGSIRRRPAILRSQQSRQKIFRDDKTLAAFNSLYETYEKSSSAIVCCGARGCLFYSGASFGLLLRRPLLPISIPGALLPISLSQPLLSAPDLGCRRQWRACRVLSLLVNGLANTSAARRRQSKAFRIRDPNFTVLIFPVGSKR
jgi:hypothetical protein